MEVTCKIVVQVTITRVLYWIIICIEWLFTPIHLIWHVNIFKIIKSQRLNIVVKLVWDYNLTKQMAHDLVLNNGNSVDGKAWLIIICNGFEKLSHVRLDLFGNTNTQYKMNKIISRCSVNDILIVQVYGGDDGCSWTINTLIDKCRMYCNNLGKFIIICIIPYGNGNDLSRGIYLLQRYKFLVKNNKFIVDIPDTWKIEFKLAYFTNAIEYINE